MYFKTNQIVTTYVAATTVLMLILLAIYSLESRQNFKYYWHNWGVSV